MFSTDIVQTIVKIVVLLIGILLAAAYFVLVERRVAAWIQDRRGPNRVGLPLSLFRRNWKDISLFGLGQPIVDGLKMILKEEYTPAQVDRRLYVLAPVVIMAAALAVFAVVPFGDRLPPISVFGNEPIQLVAAPDIDVGVIYVFALSSIAVYGVILGGWASNSKYSFLGGLRSSAQMIAYELPLGLALLGVVLATGSLRLTEIIQFQASESGLWFAFVQPLGFLVFLVAAFAEAGRLPFDLPEAEQELVGGYHTEYAGMKLVLFLTAEFIHMITASFLIVILFLGGWHLWGMSAQAEPTWPGALLRIAVLMAKIVCVILFFMLIRWSWPRFRFDQLMSLAWKVMLPLGLVNLLTVAILQEVQHPEMWGGWFQSTFGHWSILIESLVGWGVAGIALVAVALMGSPVTDNRPRHHLQPNAIDRQI